MAATTVRTEQSGRVLTVRLHNPPHNFMNSQMVVELDELTRELESDGSIGAVVVTGDHPESFIAHYDVAEILAGSEQVGRHVPVKAAAGALRATGALARLPGAKQGLRRTPAAGLVELRRIHEVFLRMNLLDKVFVAAINGMATGGGCELALACDLRLISSEGGPIGQPEILLGLVPGAGGSQRLARLLGAGRALELSLEGRGLDPEEAERIGLVHRVVAADRLLEEAQATAERLARRAPETVAALKRAVYLGGSKSLPEGLHMERAGFLATTSSETALRAMRAYAAEVESRGVPPFRDPDAAEPWLEGTAVRLA